MYLSLTHTWLDLHKFLEHFLTITYVKKKVFSILKKKKKSELKISATDILFCMNLFIHDRRSYHICVCLCIGNENRSFRGREPVSPAEEFLHLSQPNLRAVRAHLQQQNIHNIHTPRASPMRLRAIFLFFIIIKFDSLNLHAHFTRIIYTNTARGLDRNIISSKRAIYHIYYNICTDNNSIESGIKPHLFML